MLRIHMALVTTALLILPHSGICRAAQTVEATLTHEQQADEDTRPSIFPEEAAPIPPPFHLHRLTYSNLLALRYNPLGGEDRFDLRYRYRLYEKTGPLFRDAHLGIAFSPTVNFTMSRIGLSLIAKPLAVVTVTAGYYFSVWYGAFGYLQSYASAREDHSDTQIDEGDDAGNSYGTTGHELHLGAMLLGKVGPVVLRVDNNFHFAKQDLQGGDSLYYTPRHDALVANPGWLMINDFDLVYLSDFGLVAGVRGTLTHAFYKDEHFLPGESTENPNTPTFRLGPLAAYVFYDKPEKKFNKPTILLIVNWWLRHRFRTGDDVHQAVPYAVLGFKFEGELWGRN
jgi:hypothetical protein